MAKRFIDGKVQPRKYTQANVAVTSNDGLSGFSVTHGWFVPYQTADGSWFLKMNVRVTFTSTSISGAAFSIAGVVFKTGLTQGVEAYTTGVTNVGVLLAQANGGTDDVAVSKLSTSNNTQVIFAGDVELDGKPTWAV
jgi:hypothetical protein